MNYLISQSVLKHQLRESRLVNARLLFVAIFVGVLFLVVMVRLAVLQIVEHEYFDLLSNKNRVDIVAMPPQRGLIYDRHGVILAENIPIFSLEMIPEQIVDIDATLQGLVDLFSMSSADIANIKQEIKDQRAFHSVILRQRLTEQEVAQFAVNRHQFAGVDVVGRLIRHYPYEGLFSHVVGYVGLISKHDRKHLDEKNYKGTLYIGKSGIEKYYETLLHGQVGYQQVETNVRGRIVRELHSMPSVSGQNLFLHLDVKLQRIATEALADFNGAVVALEAKTGGVLTMVSTPYFDTNALVSGISLKAYSALISSVDRPLFNRALRGHYPPGSTLKPFFALAGLEADVIEESDYVFCPGWFTLPGHSHQYRCWKEHGHGDVDLKEAISQSCDTYFYDLAYDLGIDRMHAFLDIFGFGRLTGIDMPNESKGLLPSRTWKLTVRNQPWFLGETLISGIGQGFNQTTPLQLAHATSMLAMRGNSVRPQIARASASRVAGQSNIKPLNTKRQQTLPIKNIRWQTVIDSMVETVHGERGTARGMAKGLPFKVAGKTGTAQVFSVKQDEKYDERVLARKLHDHALFIAFAPAGNPEFVIAVVVENGSSGSRIAAPIARKMIDAYFGTAS